MKLLTLFPQTFSLPDDEQAKKMNSYVFFLVCSGAGASLATFLMVSGGSSVK